MSDNGRNLRLGVDVGGTFTDLVALSEGGLTTARSLQRRETNPQV